MKNPKWKKSRVEKKNPLYKKLVQDGRDASDYTSSQELVNLS